MGMENQFDIVIAGGGLAGLLAAVRIHEANKDLSILLVEKESVLGGRLKTQNIDKNQWEYGFPTIHDKLFDFWNQTLKDDPEAEDLPTFASGQIERAGILAANRMTPIEVQRLFSSDGAHAIAGSAAERDWAKVEQVIEKLQTGKCSEQSFGHVWPGTRKDPSTIILGLLGNLWGVTDIWGANAEAFVELLAGFKVPRWYGNWQAAIASMMRRPSLQSKLAIKTKCRIANSTYHQDQSLWHISTEQGIFTSPHLTVACPPLEALSWLSKESMPQPIIQQSVRVRPVSVVTVSDSLTTTNGEMPNLPDVILVPAEQVQIMVDRCGNVCYQATLDYELTLQAPDVIKAVKRLKRARKKLLTLYADLDSRGDHLALKPVGWPRLPVSQNMRLMRNLGEQKFQASHLTFCGDAYGGDCESDLNIIISVNSTVETCRNLVHM